MATPVPADATASRIHASTEALRRDASGLVLWFDEIGPDQTALVGGKAASLAELIRELGPRGVRVPDGFATTAEAHRAFLAASPSQEAWPELREALAEIDIPRSEPAPLGSLLRTLLAQVADDDSLLLHERADLARRLALATPVPDEIRTSITSAYRRMCTDHHCLVDVAVRSSATCEDSAEASFAGQYDSFLNVRGVAAVMEAWRRCAASAYTERVLSYQRAKGLDPLAASLSVVVQRMVRSDIASSGVLFTLDPDSGNPNVMVVTGSWGLGEPVVQGAVSPDTYVVWKEGLRRNADAIVHRSLGSKQIKMVYTDDGDTRTVAVPEELRGAWTLSRSEVEELARMALLVEEHYGRPMDIEWAKDGRGGRLFLVQARPETVHAGRTTRTEMEIHSMDPALVSELKENGSVVATGHSVGSRIASGRVRRFADYGEVIEKERALRKRLDGGTDRDDLAPEDLVFEPGDVLVTDMTTPDWEPLMRKASLIVTAKGGRTSHAAIVAREFGIPAVVGCGDDVQALKTMDEVTGSCAEGDVGYVFRGRHPFERQRVEVDAHRELQTGVKLNIGFPDRALRDAMLPSDGVGLARIEFILTSQVGIHPTLLAHGAALRDFVATGEVPTALAPFEARLRSASPGEVEAVLEEMDRRTGDADGRSFFVSHLVSGIARICAAFYPRPVLVRLSDLKSNEYRDLLGGCLFEPTEENPMIAWRGASRYTDPRFRAAFEMELEALRHVRRDMALDNLQIMVPFCRTPEEGGAVVSVLREHTLSPDDDVPLYLMVELPSNVLQANDFIEEMGLSGGSMGTNDLVQTIYALSRDDLGSYGIQVDARSPCVRRVMRESIRAFQAKGLEMGICGQAPSDHPDDVPPFLVESGISSISVTSDTLLRVRSAVARAEAARLRRSSAASVTDGAA